MRTLFPLVLGFALGCSSKEEVRPVAPLAPIGPLPSAAPGASASATPTSALETKESKAVARTLVRVSQLRGVTASRPVPGVKLERDELVGRIKDKAMREYPPEALRREGQLLQLFGFAPASFDYLGEMMKLLGSQLEGFYEPNNGTMYLAADLKGKEAQATLAHELVHALQDQNWDLKSRSTYRPGKGDETLALACLAEGDATSLMMDFVMSEQDKTALDLPEPMLRELMKSGMNGEAIRNVPHILRSSLIAPYVDGLSFIHALRRKGGWEMVDRVWAKPPVTTVQVLHLEKWEAHEPALVLAAPTAAALGSGWKLDDEDTFGELGFVLTYEEWLPAAEARSAASGWGGDRSAVYTRSDDFAFAVHTRFDPGAKARAGEAQNAMTKLVTGMKKKLGKAAIDTADTLCFERADRGPLLVARKDLDLVLLAGPATNTASTWTSASTCATAKKWSTEILATP